MTPAHASSSLSFRASMKLSIRVKSVKVNFVPTNLAAFTAQLAGVIQTGYAENGSAL